MKKFFIKIAFPDITLPQMPEVTTSFPVIAETAQQAANKAHRWGIAMVRDMMRHNGINPYEIEQAAPQLVRIITVGTWREKE